MVDSSQELLSFPCRFPVKVMGLNAPDFAEHIEHLIKAHVEEDDLVEMQLRPSKAERYLSVTVVITATSRDQMDTIYQALTDDERVIMAL